MPLYNTGDLYADVTLTHNQILALNSTPIQIVAAPGAGYANVVTFMYASATFVSVAYTATGSLNLIPTGSTGITLATVGTGILNASANTLKSGQPASNPVVPANTAISVFCSTGNPTGASADTVVKIRAFYKVLPAPLP